MLLLDTFFWLLVAHACTDVWWQDERMIIKKSRRHNPASWGPWMVAHALLNGAGVALVMGGVWPGIVETLSHLIIDTSKEERLITFWQDQGLHLLCKGCYLVMVFPL